MKEIIIGIFVVAIILLILYFVHAQTLLAHEVSLHKARKGLASGKFRSIVDVRKASEYQAGHYKGAVSFPLETINEQTVTRKEISDRIYSPVLVYCNSGRRAKEAAERIAGYGIEDVYYVSEPYWKLADE